MKKPKDEKNATKAAAPVKPERKVSASSIAPASERPTPKKQGSWWIVGRSNSDKEKGEPTLVVAKTKNPDQMPTAAAEAGELLGVVLCTLPR